MEYETNKPNPFKGIWENEMLNYVFTETNATGINKINSNIIFTGLYEYDGIHLIIYEEDRTFLIHYTFKNNTLIILFEGSSSSLERIEII